MVVKENWDNSRLKTTTATTGVHIVVYVSIGAFISYYFRLFCVARVGFWKVKTKGKSKGAGRQHLSSLQRERERESEFEFVRWWQTGRKQKA